VGTLSLQPLTTARAEEYWRVFLAGRTDVPTRSLGIHLDRFLSLSPEEQRTHFALERDGRIIGTVRLLPGAITGFAMDPAFKRESTFAILKVLDLLRAQGAGSISATYEDAYSDAFAALGFRRVFERMRMEAPTMKGKSPAAVELKHPEETEILELPEFFRNVYEGHMEQAFGMHVGTETEWRGYITGLLRGDSGRFMPDASFVALDGRMVGALLLSHWMGMPLIAELGVAKDRRGSGLGRALMSVASNRLAALGESRWSLYVTIGNDPAIRLYDSLGFGRVGGRTVTAQLPPSG
jgi:ribosomal protein S18 acetylase RimI-like enzyme